MTSTSAPAQACRCQSSYADVAYVNTWTVSVEIGCRGSVEKYRLLSAVNSKRRGFTRHARQREQDARQDARQRGRDDDGEHGSRLRRAQRERTLAQRLRHEQQQLLGRPHDEREHHDRERERAGERRELMEGQHGDAVREHADHDRRDAVERVGGEPGRGREPRASELRRVDAGNQPDRNGDDRAHARHDQRPDDGVRHAAARFSDGRRHVREERHVERRDALRDDVEQHERERHQREQHGARRERHDKVRQEAAPAIAHHATSWAARGIARRALRPAVARATR